MQMKLFSLLHPKSFQSRMPPPCHSSSRQFSFRPPFGSSAPQLMRFWSTIRPDDAHTKSFSLSISFPAVHIARIFSLEWNVSAMWVKLITQKSSDTMCFWVYAIYRIHQHRIYYTQTSCIHCTATGHLMMSSKQFLWLYNHSNSSFAANIYRYTYLNRNIYLCVCVCVFMCVCP